MVRIVTPGEDGRTDAERLTALEGEVALIKAGIADILEKVTLACEAAGIAQASPPPEHRKRHLSVVKGLLAGGAAWVAARKLLAGAAATGVAVAAASAVVLLPARPVHVTERPAVAALAPPKPAAAGNYVPSVAPAVPVSHRHHAAVALAAASAAPQRSPAPPPPSPSPTVQVSLPGSQSPACITLPLLPHICVGL